MPKILLVDDMRNFLDLEISFLRRADCRIVTAKDGVEALKLAKTETPDLVLLDLEMPRMNGIECLRFIKADGRLRHTPVVIVTALDKKAECVRAGADDFVRKPINEEAFLREIKKFVKIVERKDDRVEASVKVDYTFKKRDYSAYTSDLSLSGLFLITSDILPLDSDVSMTVELPDGRARRKFKARGKVMRIVEEASGDHAYTGMGIRFTDLPAQAKKNLRAFLSRPRQA